jgi:hypothetical protein
LAIWIFEIFDLEHAAVKEQAYNWEETSYLSSSSRSTGLRNQLP